MELSARIEAFVTLGSFLSSFSEKVHANESDEISGLEEAIEQSCQHNKWFTRENILYALARIAKNLTRENLESWLALYNKGIEKQKRVCNVGVVMAGNIPLVGFHDFLCVLISGHKLIAKLSGDDRFLLPFIARFLGKIDKEFNDHITFSDGRLQGFDAIIATGSNNTSRYFEYYFAAYPHIIRRNRNGIAVLDGNETDFELTGLFDDIFRYFGLGCRSVSKLFVPAGYNFDRFFLTAQAWETLAMHHKYISNYTYYKALYQMVGELFMDNGFMILKKDQGFSSPVAVVFYEEYDDIQKLNARLIAERNMIQCVVSSNPSISNAIPFGCTQQPALSDFSDGVDTLDFLLNL
jgi:hypothetical protein